MRDMRPLVLPIDDLGRRHGKRLEAEILEKGREQKGAPVEEEIRLSIMMEIEGRRLVDNVFEDAVRKPLSQGQGPGELRLQHGRQEEFLPEGGDVGHPEKREPQIERIAAHMFKSFLAHGIGPILSSGPGGVNAPAGPKARPAWLTNGTDFAISDRERIVEKRLMQKTLAIIKPDAVKKNVIGKIITRIEDEGFKIAALRLARLSADDAKAFYIVHEAKPFYQGLAAFMSSGPIVVLMLERQDAIARWREVMGATDPAKAAPGTLRHAFGFDIERNAVHGSDSADTAAWELNFFFKS